MILFSLDVTKLIKLIGRLLISLPFNVNMHIMMKLSQGLLQSIGQLEKRMHSMGECARAPGYAA